MIKLYTEEQVRKAIRVAGQLVWEDEEIFASLPPIELPSDLKQFHEWIEDNEWYFNPISFNGVIQYRWVKEFWCGQETTDELYKIYIEEQILNQKK